MSTSDTCNDRAAGILPYATSTGRLLLEHRSEDANKGGTWGVWGGRMEACDDSFRDTAEREFVEETQYEGPLSLQPLHDYEDGLFLYRTFWGTVPCEFHPVLSWESQDFEWVSLETLTQRALHFGFQALLEDRREWVRTRCRRVA